MIQMLMLQSAQALKILTGRGEWGYHRAFRGSHHGDGAARSLAPVVGCSLQGTACLGVRTGACVERRCHFTGDSLIPALAEGCWTT